MPPRTLFHWQTDEATAAPADVEAGADAADVSTDVAPGEPSAGEAAAPAWTPSREEFEALQYQLGQMQQAYQQPEDVDYVDYGDPGDEQPLQLDPFSDDYGQNLAAFMQQTVQQAVEQATAPYIQRDQQERYQEADRRALDILESFKNQEGFGDFDPALAKELARQHMDSAAARWGGLNPRAAEAALEQGARQLAENNKKVAEQAVNAYKAQIGAVGQAPGEPGTGGSAVRTIPDVADEEDLARRFNFG